MNDRTIRFTGIGTQWEVAINQEVSAETMTDLTTAVQNRVEEFDRTYSRFRSDSLVAKIAQQSGSYTFPEDAELLFATYAKLYQATEGKVTPLIGSVLDEAGYDAQYSLQPHGPLPKVQPWEAVMSYEHPTLTTKEPALLDFGAAGKGYLVDIVARLIEDFGISSYTVDGSGDMAYRNVEGQKLRVGLEDPHNASQAIGVVELGNESICASATNRRAWADLHHIIDPDTRTPVKNVLATWVVAATTIIADGLATALFFTEPKQLLSFFPFDFVILYADLSCQWSPNLHGEIFTKQPA